MQRATLKQRQALAYLKRHTMQLNPEHSKRLHKLGLFSRAQSSAIAQGDRAGAAQRRLLPLVDRLSTNTNRDSLEWEVRQGQIKTYIQAGIDATHSKSSNEFVLGCVGGYRLAGSPLAWNDLDTTGLSQEELRALLYIISLSLVERQKSLHYLRHYIRVGTGIALALGLLIGLLHTPLLSSIWPF